MKKHLQKHLTVLGIAASAALLLTVVPALVGATGPNSTPPGGSIIPTFNGLKINSGSGDYLDISGNGEISNPNGNVNIKDSDGLYIMDDNGGNGFQVLPTGEVMQITPSNPPAPIGNLVNTVSTVTGGGVVGGTGITAPWTLNDVNNQPVFSISGQGWLSSNVANAPLTVVDPDGLVSTSQNPSWAALSGQGVNAGVMGTASAANGIGGTFSSNSTGVQGMVNVGVSNGYGVRGIANTGGIGVRGDGSVGGEFIGDIGVYGMAKDAASIAGRFNSVGSNGTSVYLGGISYAINAVGNIMNQGLTIAANGDISSNSGTTQVNNALNVNGKITATSIGTVSITSFSGNGFSVSKSCPTTTGVVTGCLFNNIIGSLQSVTATSTSCMATAQMQVNVAAICFDPAN